jgi:hypothetical protein
MKRIFQNLELDWFALAGATVLYATVVIWYGMF